MLRYHFTSANPPGLSFRALLTEGGREGRFELVALGEDSQQTLLC